MRVLELLLLMLTYSLVAAAALCFYISTKNVGGRQNKVYSKTKIKVLAQFQIYCHKVEPMKGIITLCKHSGRRINQTENPL